MNVGLFLTHSIGRTDEGARQLTKNLDATMRRRAHMICNFIRRRLAGAVQPKREKAAANRGFSMLVSRLGNWSG
ncbi:hypothetical protein [Mesorhizobium muleiense]|uniref:hypothetical protein n=1 Tax=Mesorhizobium muleiense TaxID=1004279 RepID=UPI001F2CB311|nr:hypothetical protein [Mesorhizobium muleiense]MCF6109762.1 hypothetical protein [Mesorhizobium muleiense]